jgi:hypothetical protein
VVIWYSFSPFWYFYSKKNLATLFAIEKCLIVTWYFTYVPFEFVAIWYSFSPFWYFIARKIWQPRMSSAFKWSTESRGAISMTKIVYFGGFGFHSFSPLRRFVCRMKDLPEMKRRIYLKWNGGLTRSDFSTQTCSSERVNTTKKLLIGDRVNGLAEFSPTCWANVYIGQLFLKITNIAQIIVLLFKNYDKTWDRCYDFKNIFAKKVAKYRHFLLKLLLVFAKIWSQHCFLRKMLIISPKIGKNCRKLWS